MRGLTMSAVHSGSCQRPSQKVGFNHFYRLTRSNAGGAFLRQQSRVNGFSTPAGPGLHFRKHPLGGSHDRRSGRTTACGQSPKKSLIQQHPENLLLLWTGN
jgi:hypothetical protein